MRVTSDSPSTRCWNQTSFAALVHACVRLNTPIVLLRSTVFVNSRYCVGGAVCAAIGADAGARASSSKGAEGVTAERVADDGAAASSPVKLEILLRVVAPATASSASPATRRSRAASRRGDGVEGSGDSAETSDGSSRSPSEPYAISSQWLRKIQGGRTVAWEKRKSCKRCRT